MKKFLLLASLVLSFFIARDSQAATAQLYYDIKVDSFSVTPAVPAVNQKCRITVKVKNIGTKALVSSTGVNVFTYRFDNFQLTSMKYDTPTFDTAGMVAVNGYVNYYFEGKFTKAGSNNLFFSVNGHEDLIEEKISDDGYTVKLYDDDTATGKFDIIEDTGPDLTISSTTMSEAFPVANKQVSLTVEVKNIGKVSVNDDTALKADNIAYGFGDMDLIRASTTPMPTLDTPMDTGDTVSYTYLGVFRSGGKKDMYFTVDKNSLVREADETNNQGVFSATVYADQTAADDFTYSDPVLSPISSTSFAVSFTTSKPATSTINFGRGNIISLYDKVMFYNTSVHHATMTALAAGSVYGVNIVLQRGWENRTDGKIWNVTLPSNDTPQFTSAPQVSVSGYTATVNWKTNMLSSAVLYYAKSDQAYASKNYGASINNSQSLANLPAGNYKYYMVLTSLSGQTATSSTGSFSIASEPTTTSTNTVNTGSTASTVDSTNLNQNLASSLRNTLKGKILLRVEASGKAYYINSKTKYIYFLGRPEDAFGVMRSQGMGIRNIDLKKIPMGLASLSGVDTDGDGLPDALESALGTDKNNKDTDGDGSSDKDEILAGYDPLLKNARSASDATLTTTLKGRILLQVESKGEAWYVNPADGKRYFLGRPTDAFNVMRKFGLGVSEKDFNSIIK